MAKYEISLSAFNAYRLVVEASNRENAEEEALRIWREEPYDWNKALYDTTELFVDDVEELE